MQVIIDIPDDHKRVIDNLVIDGKGYLLPNEVENTLAKAVKAAIPLPKGHGRYKADVLDKIGSEIASLSNTNPSYWHSGDMVDREDVMDIIDKYKAESEDK